MAIGAGRGAIVRQLLTESSCWLAGARSAFLLANLLYADCCTWGAGFQYVDPVELNLRVLAATLLLTLMTSLLFGPGASNRHDARGSALDSGRSGRGLSGGKRRWSRQALVAGEVELSVVVVGGAGLLCVRSHTCRTESWLRSAACDGRLNVFAGCSYRKRRR